jgi:hypothetical protein
MAEVDSAIRKRLVQAVRRANVEQRLPRAEPTQSEWVAMALTGAPAIEPRVAEPDLSSVFEERLANLSSIDRGVDRFRRSDWVGELSKEGRPVDEFVDAILARVLESPTEATLREAQIVLNDLGRLPGAGSQIARRLTQEVADKLISGRR